MSIVLIMAVFNGAVGHRGYGTVCRAPHKYTKIPLMHANQSPDFFSSD
jgi:hypothetical protein